MQNILKRYGYYIILSLIFIFGFLLRLKWLIANPSFWDDECSLAWNVIHKNYGDFFSVLNFTQVAPPFFMIYSKFLTKLFGVSDLVLRLAPFTFGILSIVLFYLVTVKIFQNKITILASNFLFTINQTLVNYSSEFKQYSCDVFFTLLCLYLFINLLTKKHTLKTYIIYSLIFAVSIWFSFVSVFAITAGLITYLIKAAKEKSFNYKHFLVISMPFAVSCLVYLNIYILKTYSTNINDLLLCPCWKDGFINKDLSNILNLITYNIYYFFFPIILGTPASVLLLLGLINLTKKNLYIALIFIATIFFEIFASWLGLYPFKGRVILFLLPIIILFICAVFEYIKPTNGFNKQKNIVILIIFLAIFYSGLASTYKFLFNTPKPNRGFYDREMISILAEKIRPNETILVNKYSVPDFKYYSYFYKISNKVIIEPQNSLKRKQRYWLYQVWGKHSDFDELLSKEKSDIILEIKGNGYPSKLIYFYLK